MAETPISTTLAAAPSFRIGDVFGRAWGVYSRHLIIFSLFGALDGLSDLLEAVPYEKVSAAAPFVFWVLTPFTQAVVLYGTVQDMRGRRFGVIDSIKKGLARFLPILGLLLCETFAAIIAAVALIVPAVMVIVAFYVALPACVVEKLGPIASLERSAELTKGNRWRVFAIVLPLTLVAFAVEEIYKRAPGFLPYHLSWALAHFAWQAVFGAYSSIVVAVLYRELRMAREGVDLDEIAAVFD